MQLKQVDVFPTRLWIFDIPELKVLHPQWIRLIEEWRARDHMPAGRSNRHGWNSAKTLMGQPEFAPLRHVALQAFTHAFQQMELTGSLGFALEGWVNLQDPGGYNIKHIHGGCLMSASYYLQVPSGSGPIVFHDPRPGVTLGPFQGKGIHCQSAEVVQPKEGLLVVFPNWLEHSVEENQSNDTRISLAMNALLASPVGK